MTPRSSSYFLSDMIGENDTCLVYRRPSPFNSMTIAALRVDMTACCSTRSEETLACVLGLLNYGAAGARPESHPQNYHCAECPSPVQDAQVRGSVPADPELDNQSRVVDKGCATFLT